MDNLRKNKTTVKNIKTMAQAGDTYASIAATYNTTIGTIAGIIRDVKAGILIVDSVEAPSYDQQWTLFGNAVVIADLHIPKIDTEFIKRVLPTGKYYGIRRLHIAGDLLDGGAYSGFRRTTPIISMTQELEDSRKILSYLTSWFNEVYFSMGNHDSWFILDQDGRLDYSAYYYLLKDSVNGDFFVTPYDTITYKSSGEKWTVVHPNGYKSSKLSLANDLAQSLQTNVIVAHQHFSAIGYDKFGRYVTIDIGGMHDPKKFDYVQLHTAARSAMNQGFAVIKDGAGFLLTPDKRLTDWNIILGTPTSR